MAQVWLRLARSRLALRPVPRLTVLSALPSEAGLAPRSTVSPWPSWPELFAPQHLTMPSSNSAHAKSEPTATESDAGTTFKADDVSSASSLVSSPDGLVIGSSPALQPVRDDRIRTPGM